MISRAAIRPVWTIASSMWMARRPGFIALLLAPLVCGWLFHLLSADFIKSDGAKFLGNLPLGLSLFLTFVFCNFTETDRRGRSDGFPARLFTLPLPTCTLIVTPIVFSVIAVAIVYLAWVKFALPALGKELPLSWPVLYLATGMICYQSIAWSLARFRIARLFTLGVGGTFLATGWLAFRSDAEAVFFSSLPNGIGARPLMCALLAVISVAAAMAAGVIIENQRRGGMGNWTRRLITTHGQRTIPERIADALPPCSQKFATPARAQFWFEWRRHGSLLPLATGALVLLIVSVAAFNAPISSGRAGLILCWILALPLILAFVLGKGFGKADLWSKEPGLPLFMGTRPLSNSDLIGAKIKAATLAVVCAWLIVLVVTPLWLWLGCDAQSLLHHWRSASVRDPRVISFSVVAIPILVLFTWRLLVGSLYIGLSGRAWMLNVAACGVFLSFFSPMIGAIPIVQQNVHRLLFPPKWLPWLLGVLFVAKVVAAVLLAGYSRRKGYVTAGAIRNYGMVWCGVALALVALVWPLIPFEMVPPDSGWTKPAFALLVLFAVPLLRISYAPIALAQSRRR